MSIINSNDDGSNPEEPRLGCISQKDLQMLYNIIMEGETLKGLIYEPDESDDLMLVFDKHTINLASDGVISITERR